MKHLTVFTALFLILSNTKSLAQDVPFPDGLSEKPSTSIGFILNKGQVVDTERRPKNDIYYRSVNTFPMSFFLKDKISIVSHRFNKDSVNLVTDSFARLDMTWKYSEVGFNVTPLPSEETAEYYNYYLDYCPDCDSLAKFKRLTYPQIYQGVDLSIYSNEMWFKYYFILDKGKKSDIINLTFDGQQTVVINPSYIRLTLGSDTITLPQPFAYQLDSNNNISYLNWQPTYYQTIYGGIGIKEAGFVDPSKKLVYQIAAPIFNKTNPDQRNLEWSSFLGGGGFLEELWDIEHKSTGQIYVTGYSTGENYPTTKGAGQTTKAGEGDIVISKFNNDLSLSWSTYHGGSQDDGGVKHGITIDDKSGDAFVAAATYSTNIVLRKRNNAYYDNKNTCQGSECTDLIVSKYNANMGTLEWATYYGGDEVPAASGMIRQSDIYLDKDNFLYVTGIEGGTNIKRLPLADPNAFFSSQTEGAFICRFNSNLDIDWSTGFGKATNPMSICKTGDNKLILVGSLLENSTLLTHNYPGAYNQPSFGGGTSDGFISRFDQSFKLEWSTYIGGDQFDAIERVTIDEYAKTSDIYLTGSSVSTNFPFNGTAFFQTTYNGPFPGPNTYPGYGDIIIAKANSTGQITATSFYGGADDETGLGISVCFNQVFVAGLSESIDFPLLSAANQDPNLYYNNNQYNSLGGSMGYFLGFDSNLDRQWTTFYGGSTNSAILPGGTINSTEFHPPYLYFVGGTSSDDATFPVYNTPTSYRSTGHGDGAFIGRFNMANTTLGLQDELDMELSRNLVLYPNPVYSKAQINCSKKIRKVLVSNSIGQLTEIVNIKDNVIDLSSFEAGIYFLSITTIDEITYHSKCIKE